MIKPVAIGIAAQASDQTHPADQYKTGNWLVPGPVSTIDASNLAAEKAAIHSSSAVFSYVGGTFGPPSSPAPLPPVTSVVSLKAAGSKLTSHGQSILLEGEESKDVFGNLIQVSTLSKRLRSL